MKPTKKPCKFCKRPTDNSNGYCDLHQDKYTDYKKKYENNRLSPSKRGYDRSWLAFRELFLNNHPLCTMCEENGKITPATEVHHIKPLSDGGARLDPQNCMALCKSCHSKITVEMNK